MRFLKKQILQFYGMKVVWDEETTKKIGDLVKKVLEELDVTKKSVFTDADLHKNTFDNLLAGNPGISFETVAKGLLALELSFDEVFLALYPNRIINLKEEPKKISYIQSVFHFLKNHSVTKEEYIKLLNQYWDVPRK